jgi:hypothetical protein
MADLQRFIDFQDDSSSDHFGKWLQTPAFAFFGLGMFSSVYQMSSKSGDKWLVNSISVEFAAYSILVRQSQIITILRKLGVLG